MKEGCRRKEGRRVWKKGRKGGNAEGRTEGRKEGRRDGHAGRKERSTKKEKGRTITIFPPSSHIAHRQKYSTLYPQHIVQ